MRRVLASKISSKVNECIKSVKGQELWKEHEKDYIIQVKTRSKFIENIKTPGKCH